MTMQNLNGLLNSMWPALADAAVKSAAVLLLAWAVASLFRQSSAARRHLVWTAGVIGVLMLPLLAGVTPRWQIRFAEPAPVHLASVQVSSVPASFEAPLKIDLPHSTNLQPTQPSHAESRDPSPSLISHWVQQWRTTLVVVWLLGATILLARTLVGLLSLARLSQRSNLLVDQAWESLLAEGCEQLRIDRRVTLLASDQRIMPMTWGILRPKILLPESATAWPQHQRRIVLLHELAHIRRHDCVIHLLSQLARAVFWFNPFSWVAVRQMMLDREIASDDLVVSRGILASDYAEHLIHIASSFKVNLLLPSAAIAMARSSRLSVRVRAVLDPARPRHLAGRKFGVAVCAAAISLLLPLAMLRPFTVNAQQAGGGGDKPANVPVANLVLPPVPLHTQVLLHVDLSKLTPDSLDTTAFTIFGKPYRDSGADKQMLSDFGNFYDVVARHGVSQLWLLDIMIGPDDQSPYAPEMIIEVKNQAQADALQADLKARPSSQGNDYFVDGKYLIVRRGLPARDGVAPVPPTPTPNDPATAGEFEKAMRSARPNDTVQLALMFDDTITRASAALPPRSPPALQKFAELTETCKSVTISAQPGGEPTIKLAVQSTDAAGATKAADLINQMLPDLLPELAGAQMMDPKFKDVRASLAEALRDVKATGVEDRAELAMDTPELKKLGTAVGPFFTIAKSQAMKVQAMNSERQLAVMIVMYTSDHDGKLPEKLDDVASYASPGDFKKVVRNANAPGVDVGYVYEKPAEKMTDLQSPVPMLWEVNPKDGKKTESGVVGYSDGHIEFHK